MLPKDKTPTESDSTHIRVSKTLCNRLASLKTIKDESYNSLITRLADVYMSKGDEFKCQCLSKEEIRDIVDVAIADARSSY